MDENTAEIEVNMDMFDEPEGFRPPPPEPTFEVYHRQDQCMKEGEPKEIKLRLVGKSPLWGHLLWNAGKVTADWIDLHRDSWCKGKTVLELGAAAALPTLIACLSADNVVSTDYPDPELIENIKHNVKLLEERTDKCSAVPVEVEGYIWGNSVEPLLNTPRQNGRKFDLIILSDLIFNHTEHQKLIRTCNEALSDDGICFVMFTPHRPKLFHKDLEFFESAKPYFTSEKVLEKKLHPMFEEEEETKELRSMVFGYVMRRNK